MRLYYLETSTNQRKTERILLECQLIKIRKEMVIEQVFSTFVDRLILLQKQLYTSHRTDSFLQNRLLTAVDIANIRATLRDRMPRPSPYPVNRISNPLSDKVRSTGSSSTCVENHEGKEKMVIYSLGMSYGGDVRRYVKKH